MNFQGKNDFLQRLIYAEHKVFSICVDVFNLYEDNHFDKIIRVFSEWKKNKKKTIF